MFETARQIPLFLAFLLLGAILGAVYDVLYVLRLKRGFLCALGDACFCVCFFVLMAFFTYKLNFGQMRFYFLLGAFLGFLLERISIGYFIKIFIDFWAKILYNLSVYIKRKLKAKDRHDGKEQKEEKT